MALKTYQLMAIALLAALGAVFQLSHDVLGVSRAVTGFMYVDLVAVPVLLAFFVLGFEASLYVAVLISLLITILTGDWIGASMKFAATLPMMLVPALMLLLMRRKYEILDVVLVIVGSIALAVVALILAGTVGSSPIVTGFVKDKLVLGLLPIIVLAGWSVLLAYLWRKYGGSVDMTLLARSDVLVLTLLLALLVRGFATVVSNYYYAIPIFFGMDTESAMSAFPWYIIFGWNAVQGIIEMGIAWVLAFRFGFVERYARLAE